VPWWPVTTVLLVVFGLIVTVHNVLSVSLRQAITPDEIIGRMMAVHRFLSWGALPVGAIVGGLVADRLGLQLGIGLTAAAAGVAGCLALLPLLRPDRAQFAYGL
jgi:fucose permease